MNVCVCVGRGGGRPGGGEAVRVRLGTIISRLLGASGYEVCPSKSKNNHRLGRRSRIQGASELGNIVTEEQNLMEA